MLKKIVLLLALCFSFPALADHNPSHKCIAIDAFEAELKQKNPDYHYTIRKFPKIDAMRFITFSFMEFGVPPPDEPSEMITGLYQVESQEKENTFVAIMNGDKICSNTILNKKTFQLIMESLESTK